MNSKSRFQPNWKVSRELPKNDVMIAIGRLEENDRKVFALSAANLR